MDARLSGSSVTCPKCGHRHHPVIVRWHLGLPGEVRCSVCGHVGTVYDFGRMTERERKECRREQWRNYYHSHKELCKERNRECAKRYRERHREEINKRNRERRSKDLESARERESEYREANRERINARHKEWRDAKRESMGEAAYLREQRMRNRAYRRSV